MIADSTYGPMAVEIHLNLIVIVSVEVDAWDDLE